LEGGFETWKDHQLDIEEEAAHRYRSVAGQPASKR